MTLSYWDDWFKYQTLYTVSYVDADGTRHSIGSTKIGMNGLLPRSSKDEKILGHRTPPLPPEFESLDTSFFSIGQDADFYEELSKLGDQKRNSILHDLRDLAFDLDSLERALEEDVTKVSLLRDVSLQTVRDQFARMAHGGVKLTPFRFSYQLLWTHPEPSTLVFEVEPNSLPPSNIHVLIGRNGVGKSTLLNTLTNHMVKQGTNDQVSNIVSVSFSAFDAFEPIDVPEDRATGPTYHYVGLKKLSQDTNNVYLTRSTSDLAAELLASARSCLLPAKKSRWLRALDLLEGDPVFRRIDISNIITNGATDKDVLFNLERIFGLLSSGHKIVLLTITKLIETVEEKSLVLLDEPEAHLHPPLLSAFIRALSDLLTNRNGVAIVATHSPVVLQEVPRSCVWRINRWGNKSSIDRLNKETFGENVGTLTSEVFGLEVTASGFHRMLSTAAGTHDSYDSALASFGGQLGEEGRAILRAMMYNLRNTSDVAR
ncbi:AAA family ATPase [Rathayibacter sp. VKM Ac-2857]|uniref:AAA family ATPase n=1 Tax=Rathayibacter sp. VKM Ac-2857 TaxID=2739020 RepID=UPI001C2078A3|nr:AAA family ATPase [Rathayibacter sp. VKM Ac-2857]